MIKVTRKRAIWHRKSQSYEESISVSYYISNDVLTAKEYAGYIRNHWFIENKLHHVKDTAFQEDSLRKEKKSEKFSTCIDISLNILRKIKVKNVKGSLFENCMKLENMIERVKSLVC